MRACRPARAADVMPTLPTSHARRSMLAIADAHEHAPRLPRPHRSSTRPAAAMPIPSGRCSAASPSTSTPPAADGSTALHWAVQHDDAKMVDAADSRRRQRASRERVTACSRWRSRRRTATPSVLRLLLSAGADPNAGLSAGETAADDRRTHRARSTPIQAAARARRQSQHA